VPVDDFAVKMQDPYNVLRAETLRNLGVTARGAAGVGAAVRGAGGLLDLIRGTVGPAPKLPVRQQVVTVPIPRRDEERHKYGAFQAIAAAAAKQAEAPLSPGTSLAGRALDAAGGLKAPGESPGLLRDAFWNFSARTPGAMGWALPAGVAMIGGGLYAGHKLTDMALNYAKGREDDSELDAARRRYEAALRGGAKTAAAEANPYPGLDRAFDALEKSASWQDLISQATGTYALTAGTLAALAGAGAYNYTRSHAEDKAVNEALQRRREQLFAAGPPPIVAVPEEIEEERPRGLAALRHHLGRGALPKVANLAASTNAVMARLQARTQAIRQQTLQALGVQPEPPPDRKPAEVVPPRPPSVMQAPVPAG
jgi:hypothetical protein